MDVLVDHTKGEIATHL